MGYDGQTEFITDETALNKTSVPWTENTTSSNSPKGSTRESQGGGDVLYGTDTNLVKAACGNTLKAYQVNATTTAQFYWLASRNFFYEKGSSFSYWRFYARGVDTSGSLDNKNLYHYANSGGFYDNDNKGVIRPIVILKSGIQASSGDGTKDSPWKVN